MRAELLRKIRQQEPASPGAILQFKKWGGGTVGKRKVGGTT